MGKGDDSPNKAGGRYNQIGAASSLDEIFSRVGRESEVNTVAGQRLRQQGRAERQSQRDIRTRVNIMQEGLGMSPNDPDIQAGLASARDEYAESVGRSQVNAQKFYNEKQAASVRGQNTLVSQIGQFTGSRAQASRVNEAFSSGAAMEFASRAANTTSYGDLEQQHMNASRSARETAVNLREAAAGGANRATITQLGTQLTEQEAAVGMAKRGLQMQRQLGMDPASRFMAINDVSARAADRIGSEKLNQAASNGELPSLKQLNDSIRQTAEELLKLKEGFSKGEMSLDDFNKKAGEVAGQLSGLEQQERAVQQAGGGGNGALRALASMGGAMTSGVNFAQQAFINQPIQALGNRAQIASAQNQQYATLSAALGGDMASLGLMGSGAFGDAAGFSGSQKFNQQLVQGAEVGATVIDAGARASLEVVEAQSLGSLGGRQAGSVARAAIIGAEGAFSAATTVSDMAQQVTAGQTGVTAYNAALEAQKQIIAVPSQFRQSFFDYGIGVTEATRGSGAGREGMMNTMMGDDFLNQMQGLRIDPMKAAALAGQGIAEQGSAFNINQISMSRNMEKAGLGTMEQNMSRFGKLSGAGAQDSGAAMAKMMEEAVARGMDVSKAIGMMVDATQSIAETGGTTALGVDATGGIATLLGKALGMKDGRSETARTAAANAGISTVSGSLTDDTVTFTNMVRDTAFRRMGMGGLEASRAKGVTAPMLEQLTKGGPEAERIANQLGLNALFDKKGNFDTNKAKEFANIQGNFLEAGGAGGVGMVLDPDTRKRASEAAAKLAKAGGDFSKLTPKEREFARIQNQVSGGTEANSVIQGFKGIETATLPKDTKAGNIMNGTAPQGPQTVGGEQLATGAGFQKGKEVAAGRKDLESLDKVAKVLGAIEKAVTPETMEKFAGAAAKGAEAMSIGADNFKNLGLEAVKLEGNFQRLNVLLESLNTDKINLGGFKTGGGNKALTSDDIKAAVSRVKTRADGKPAQ